MPVGFRLFQIGRPFGTYYSADEIRATCVVVAGIAPENPSPAVPLSALLAEAASEQPGELALLAAAVDERLRSLQPTTRYFAMSFAAVRLTAGQIEVCTAGDLRVHRVERQTVTHVTRDHTFATDAPAEMSDVQRKQLAHVRTRRVGGDVAVEPDTVRWPSNASSVVICSDEYHQFQHSDTYWARLADDLARGRHPMPLDATYAGGVAAELVCTPAW